MKTCPAWIKKICKTNFSKNTYKPFSDKHFQNFKKYVFEYVFVYVFMSIDTFSFDKKNFLHTIGGLYTKLIIMLIIRFVRVGKKKSAFFHLVVAEKARAVQKKYIEKIGYYNPHTNNGEGELTLEKDRLLHFIKNGAQVSQSAARLLVKNGIKEAGKFIEQRATKPKKEESIEKDAKEDTPDA